MNINIVIKRNELPEENNYYEDAIIFAIKNKFIAINIGIYLDCFSKFWLVNISLHLPISF